MAKYGKWKNIMKNEGIYNRDKECKMEVQYAERIRKM